jgi:hypothetical protein
VSSVRPIKAKRPPALDCLLNGYCQQHSEPTIIGRLSAVVVVREEPGYALRVCAAALLKLESQSASLNSKAAYASFFSPTPSLSPLRHTHPHNQGGICAFFPGAGSLRPLKTNNNDNNSLYPESACLVSYAPLAGRTLPAGEGGCATGWLPPSHYLNNGPAVRCRSSPEFPFRFIWVLLGWSTWYLWPIKS